MPSKKTEKECDKKPKCKVLSCGTKSPGPKYILKPVVGYNDHCHTKYRSPAYSMGRVKKRKDTCLGPGPKYLYKLPAISGCTIPKAVHKEIVHCTPGPKYTLPDERGGPAYSITNRPKSKCPPALSGPYAAYPVPPGPAYTIIGTRGGKTKCQFDPAIRDIGDTSLTKPNSPAFSIVPRVKTKIPCIGPGPKYLPKNMDKSPEFVFGVRHSDCITIPRTECDELC